MKAGNLIAGWQKDTAGQGRPHETAKRINNALTQPHYSNKYLKKSMGFGKAEHPHNGSGMFWK